VGSFERKLVVPVHTRFNQMVGVFEDLAAYYDALDQRSAKFTTQFHGGRYTPEQLITLLGRMDVLDLQRHMNGNTRPLPGLSLDLSQKRRIGSHEPDSTKPTEINPETGDYYANVHLGEAVCIGDSSGVAYDHHWRGNFEGTLDLKLDESVVVDDGVTIQTYGNSSGAICGIVTGITRKDGKWFANNGISSPARLNERRPDEPQFSDRDFEFLNAIPAALRRHISGFDISFAADPAKIRQAQTTLSEHGWPDALLRLKIETAGGINNLAELATIPNTRIVFACGDLAAAMEEQKCDLRETVENGLDVLANNGINEVEIAYDFGNKPDQEGRYDWFKSLQNKHPGMTIGMWHTSAAIKCKTGVEICKKVISIAQMAVKESPTT